MMLHLLLRLRIMMCCSQHYSYLVLIVFSSLNIFLKDGMGIFFNIIKYLSRPMSVAIYVSNNTKEIDEFEKSKLFLPTQSTFRYSIYYSNSDVYSYNQLRNIAIKNSVTTHIYISDMDFWPSSIYVFIWFIIIDNLYESFISLSDSYLSDEWLAVIVPAFQYNSIITNGNMQLHITKYDDQWILLKLRIQSHLPQTKEELRTCTKQKKCSGCRIKLKTHVIYIFVSISMNRIMYIKSGWINQKQETFQWFNASIIFIRNRIHSFYYVFYSFLDML